MIKKLIFSKLVLNDFYNLTIIKRHHLRLFDTILNATTKNPLKNLISTDSNLIARNKIHYITYVPPYVHVSLNNDYRALQFYRFNGFLIDLEKFNSIQDYMESQFGSKSRSKIRSYIRRLETCFDITYQMYYGDMDETVFKQLFIQLESMIKKRFDQRGDKHQALEDWDYYKQTTYQNVLNKNASLFVIYDDGKPIDICVNYHFDNIVANFIRAFDIDYYKFKLGYIDIYKQVEWSIENNINLFDLGPGILTYKKQWCNITYDFKNCLVFNKKSLTSKALAQCLLLFYKVKILLDKKKIILDKENMVKDSDNSNNKNETGHVKQIETEIIDVSPKKTELNKYYYEIDFEIDEFNYLRNTIYDYLYLNFDKKKKIKVYRSKDEPNSFILIGKKLLKLTLKN